MYGQSMIIIIGCFTVKNIGYLLIINKTHLEIKREKTSAKLIKMSCVLTVENFSEI